MRSSPHFFLLTGAFFVLLGALNACRTQPKIQKGHYSQFYQPGNLVRLLITERISAGRDRIRLEAQVVSAKRVHTRGKVFVTVRDLGEGYRPKCGDTLVTRKSLQMIAPPVNPGSFDFRTYAARKKVIHQLGLGQGQFLCLVGREKGVRGISNGINQRLQLELERALHGADALALSKALLLGYRNELSHELLDEYKAAGAMHILAISGLHVGIILLALMGITRPMRKFRSGKGIQMILVVAGLWAYALITGMTVSAVRAVSMFTLLTLGRTMNRDAGLMRNLIISAFVLLLVEPFYLFDVGFQLSYSALGGITLFASFLRSSPEKSSKINSYVVQLLSVSGAAQLGVFPLSLLYFRQFSGVFLLSSLLLLPVLGFTLGSGYTVILVSMLTDSPILVAGPYEHWIELINSAVRLISRAEVLIVRNAYFPPLFCLLAYMGLLLLYTGLKENRPAFVFFCGLILLSMQLVWLWERSSAYGKEELIVFHLWNESLVARRQGAQLILFESDPGSRHQEKVLNDYRSVFPGSISVKEALETGSRASRIFSVDGGLIFVLDDSNGAGILETNPDFPLKPKVIVLLSSPRINLDRLLSRLKPAYVVADGSNYPSFVQRWKRACAVHRVRFHATSEAGAFVYPLQN